MNNTDDSTNGFLCARTSTSSSILTTRSIELLSLPPEVISHITHSLSLSSYSYLSRTCKRLHNQLFHPSELILFLKTRYRLSVESGSIVLFAYLANLQIKAPSLLDRIFDDFFADSEIHEQERQQRLLYRQRHQDQLARYHTQTFQRALPDTELAAKRALHKEQARKQAKRDAVRMWGVLYALDKTPVASPSVSATCALVLSGAADAVDNSKQKLQEQDHHHQKQEYENSTGFYTCNSDGKKAETHAPSSAKGKTCISPTISRTDVPDHSHATSSSSSALSEDNYRPPGSNGHHHHHHRHRQHHVHHNQDGVSRASPYRANSQMRLPRKAKEQRSCSVEKFEGLCERMPEQSDMEDIENSPAVDRSASLEGVATKVPENRGIPVAHQDHNSKNTPEGNCTEQRSATIYSCNTNSNTGCSIDGTLDTCRHHRHHPPVAGSYSKRMTSGINKGDPENSIGEDDNINNRNYQIAMENSRGLLGSSTVGVSERKKQCRLPSNPPSPFTFSRSSSAAIWSSRMPPRSDYTITTEQVPQHFSHIPSHVRTVSLGAVGSREAVSVDRDDPETEPSCAEEHSTNASKLSFSSPRLYKKSRWSESPSPPSSPSLLPSSSLSSPSTPYQRLTGDKQVRIVRVGPNTPVVASVNESLGQEVGFFLSPTRIDRASPVMIEPFRGRLGEHSDFSPVASHFPSATITPSLRSPKTQESETETAPSPLLPPPQPSLKMCNMSTDGLSGKSMADSTMSFMPTTEKTEASANTTVATTVTVTSPSSSISLLRSPPMVTSSSSVVMSSPSPSTSTSIGTTSSQTMSRPNKDHQAMQNSRIKIEFLTRYTDRMRLKLEALGIEDWRVKDIQRKKTYRMMIQQNDRSGESELVHFYLDRYGGTLPEVE